MALGWRLEGRQIEGRPVLRVGDAVIMAPGRALVWVGSDPLLPTAVLAADEGALARC